MKHIKKISALVVLVLIGQSAWAQQHGLDTLLKKFDRYRKQNLQEKIYVHLDRTSFITGETLWFRIYCVNGITHLPLSISKVAYMEILDRNNQPVAKSKIELQNGSGEGSLFIPATLNTENYTVRAYTNWMKNSGPEFYFHQPITIINAFREPEKITAKSSDAYDAQFLPEGGHLVDGISGVIGYRVTDASGKGVDFTGYVIRHTSDTVIRFAPSQFGIGSFLFTPSIKETYRIVVRDKRGATQTFGLPIVQAEGFALRLENLQEKINLHVTGKFENLSTAVVYLLVQTRNRVAHSEIGYLINGNATFTLEKKNLGEGIFHITLFNAALQPVCERLYFKHPENRLNIKINSDQAQYDTRRKVKLSLTASDLTGIQQTGSFSLSVFRADTLQSFLQKSILSYFLLTSDLHGEVESPETYFKPGAEAAADLLMLTHGWRRFSWEKIFSGQRSDSLYLPEYQGHLITGKVLDESGNPSGNIKTFLSYPSRKINVYSNRSNLAGEVHYILPDFRGTSQIILQTDLANDSVHRIVIDNPFSMAFADRRVAEFKLDAASQKDLSLRSVAMQVQNVFQEDQHEQPAHPESDSAAFYGKADETYFLDDFTRFPVMEEVMREYVAGVFLRKRKGSFYLMVLDMANKNVFREDPLILVDGVPVFDIDLLMAFNPLKMKKLEVMTRLYIYGNMTFPGIVSYSTYSGDLGGFQLHPKSVVLNYEGLQQKREFYHPKYENEKQRTSRIPDQRHLLYWLPKLEIKNGVGEVEFYTSDLTGNFAVQIQGMSHSGLMGNATHRFTVKRLDN